MSLSKVTKINPWEYKDPGLYEFASHQAKENADLILFIANWLDSDPEDDTDTLMTQQYWVNRLRPLIRKPVHFVAANRIGNESGIYQSSITTNV